MEIVLFDTETTGLLLPDNAPLEEQPKIIEFYGVRINEEFEILSELETYIDPGEPITKEITQITGIKTADVEGQPTFHDMSNNIALLFAGADLSVAHNIAFDNGMLNVEFQRIAQQRPCAVNDLCTVEFWKDKYGYRWSLGAIYNKLFGSAFKAHRAKNDVHALVRCFHHWTENGEIDLEVYTK